ncbi:RCC1 domain-containing protein 1 [Cylas formicarius]|uniref:RCC1 domain-containing protein 1 n=1 Tax=Cylas formicarius TaxID=197179 RepID=UPI00295840BA|nr:RCC1 domain-containing protein 1 [Cylas formicarius]
MKVFVRGFNLYNQLNSREHVLNNFSPSIKINDAESCFKIGHTFSLIYSNNLLRFYGKAMPKYLDSKKLENILNVSCNDNFIVLLNSEGKMLKIAVDEPQLITEIPKFWNDEDKIKLISVGETMTVAVTELGNIYTISEQLDFRNQNIKVLKTGREHCILLDDYGNVYSFGRGSRGQLGHGTLDDEKSPKLINALAGIKIKNIAVGGWHSFALSVDGDLYCWGWNGNGQLGLFSDPNSQTFMSVMATPTVVHINHGGSEPNVLKVACGSRHTIALLDDNKIHGCGWNKYKQLTATDVENYYSFICLHDFSNEKVLTLICGPWCSAVCCE